MTNAEKALEISSSWKRDEFASQDEFVAYDAAMRMAQWKDEQQNLPITDNTEEANVELELDKLTLDNMKGFVSRTTLASYTRMTFEPKMEIVYKALVTITVISARDYKPHVILSVTCNGVTQHFGTDAKKAIDYYNSI